MRGTSEDVADVDTKHKETDRLNRFGLHETEIGTRGLPTSTEDTPLRKRSKCCLSGKKSMLYVKIF